MPAMKYNKAMKLIEKEKYEEAVDAYNENVGPLRITDAACGDPFSWIEEPWPWEGGCA